MIDLTPVKQQRKNAKIRSKFLMERFAHQWWTVERMIQLEVANLTDIELDGLLKHIDNLTTTNCWYAEYHAGEQVRREVKHQQWVRERPADV